MGILADYIRRGWNQADQATIAEGAQGLLGEAGWEQMGPFQPGSQGAMQQETRGYGPMIGGSGLLGGEGMMDPTNRAKFAVGLMGLPGMQNQGVGMLNQQMGGNEAMQRMMMQQQMQEQAMLDQGPTFQDTSKLRGEFNKLSAPFIDQTASYNRILNSATDPTPAGDLALIFNYMKVLDPGSTVREGEAASVQESGSVPEQVRGLYNQVVEGTRLTDSQRADFVDRAGRLYQGAQELAKQRVARYSQLAGGYGMQPGRVVTDYGVQIPQQQQAPPTGQIDRPQQMSAPGVPFEFPESPSGWATYDQDGNIVVYEVQ